MYEDKFGKEIMGLLGNNISSTTRLNKYTNKSVTMFIVQTLLNSLNNPIKTYKKSVYEDDLVY